MNSMSEQILPTMFCGLTAKEIYSMKQQLASQQLENQKLRDALEFECGNRCNSEYNPCNARLALSTPPNTDALKQYVDAEIARRLEYVSETNKGMDFYESKPVYTLKD